MRALAALVACACGAAISALPAGAAWQNYRASLGGLLDNQVFAVSEAGDGSLWFGTADGPNRFDGTAWSSFKDSVPSVVHGVLEDRRGALWFGTESRGLARFDQGRWVRWDTAGGILPSNKVETLLEDARGDLWFGMSGGLVRYEPGADRWTTYGAGTLVNQQAWRLLEDRDRNLWIATPKGVNRLDATRTVWTTYLRGTGGLVSDSVLALGLDRDGNVWFGTDQGADRYGAAGWRHYTFADGLPSPAVTAFALDSLGHLWVGGYNGIARFDGTSFRGDPITEDGTFIGLVLAIHVDRSGFAWLGTSGSGVFRYDGTTWRHFYADGTNPTCSFQQSPNIPSFDFLTSNCLTAMIEDRRGDHWFGTNYGGVVRLDRSGHGAPWPAYRRAPGVPLSDSITTVAEDHAGNLWFGSRGAGIARLDSARTTWKLWTRKNGLADSCVVATFVDGAGDVWVGTPRGVSGWSQGVWTTWAVGVDGTQAGDAAQFLEGPDGRLWYRTPYTCWVMDAARTQWSAFGAADGLPGDIVTAMLRTRGGDLWFGTTQGLARLQGSAWTVWNTVGSSNESNVTALAEAGSGAIWVGQDFSASRWEGGAWRTFSALEIGSTPVTGIYPDASGTVWLQTFFGLSRTNGDAWRRYDNRGNGLAAELVTGYLEDRQGRLWFASNGGLTEHEPDRVAPQAVLTLEPPALHSSRNVSFVFGAAYGEVTDVEYSTSWDGALFSSWGTDNTLTLTGVADGTHTFEVVARDWARNTDPTPARFTFEVDATPPAAIVSSPAFGQPVRGTVAVRGSTADARFSSYVLEAKPPGGAAWTDPGVIAIASSSAPVADGTLGMWDTSALADGDWDLRLSVTDRLGLVGQTLVRVIVDNVAPFASVTSPARVSARDGGDVYTTNSEVHLYFPPYGFDQDAVVTVDSVAAALPAPPPGAARVGPAWDIGWTGASLGKDAVLELRAPAGGAAPRAIWAAGADNAWHRLGGTPAGGSASLGLTLSGPGRYALFSETATPSGEGSLSAISLSPRAFSPQGSFATPEIAIGFSMARAGSATVKVYDRAGHLIRSVAEGMAAGPGAALVHWDGRDRDGEFARSGIYLVTVEALGETRTQTLAVVK